MQFIVTGKETWVNKPRPVNTQHCPQQRNSVVPSVRKTMATVFRDRRDHKRMLLVHFLTRGDTVTAGGYRSTNLAISPLCLSNLYQSQYRVIRTL